MSSHHQQQDSPVSTRPAEPFTGEEANESQSETHFVRTSTGADQEPSLLPHFPTAVYRLQFNRNLTFQQARPLVNYLHQLGIGDWYASPIFKSHAGSLHGYDICDHTQLNPEIGGEEEFTCLQAISTPEG
jgi:glycosidase